ncbi:MAG TPA: DUF2130 domain-containing protein [Flavipsychrobacter sp.]|nr:DUF2130 domain-containing protein [Flavipsychrobacter sp.]
MSTKITCPHCTSQFEPTDALRNELQKELRNQMVDWQKKKEDEFSKKENQFQQQFDQLKAEKEKELTQKIQEERTKLSQNLKEEITKKIAFDYETKLKFLEDANKEREDQLRTAREKELAFLKKEEVLLRKEQEMELEQQRLIREERNRISEELKKQNEEKEKNMLNEFQLKQKEWEIRFEQQQKALEDARKKAQQGSMQMQGEVQELALEALLRNSFPIDVISEVGKGVRGADCIQTVRNNFGQECGKIIYESKRTANFGTDWIEKLKADARSLGAEVAVIVTQAMPKDMDCFGEKDGVWICSFGEVKALTCVLRDLIIKVHTAAKSQENKGDKMQMLYTYLTSNEFSEQWKAIREGFMSMKLSIQKERDAMEKLWKSREKQLEKVLLNAAHIKGSIEGIAGMEEVDLNLTTTEENFLIEGY